MTRRTRAATLVIFCAVVGAFVHDGASQPGRLAPQGGTITRVTVGSGMTGGGSGGPVNVGIDQSYWQRRVTSGCLAGSAMQDVGSDGVPVCVTAGDKLGPDGDKGDVTVGASGSTLTIDSSSITYTKIQDVAGDRILGRLSSTGQVQELTGSDVATLLPTVTTSAKGLVPTAPNDTSQWLRGDGAWATLPSSLLTGSLTSGRIPFASGAHALTDSANLVWDDTNHILVNAAAGSFSGTIPTLSNGSSRPQLLMSQGSGNWGLTVGRASNDTGGPHLTLYKTRATDIGTKTAVQDGDPLGDIVFQGATSGSTVLATARIEAKVNGTVTSSSMPTDLKFYTGSADNSTLHAALYSDGGLGFVNSSSAAVSSSGEGRLRYNTTGQKFQVSTNGGSYVDIATGGNALVTANAVPRGNGTTQVAGLTIDDGTQQVTENHDANVSTIALTGIDYSALGPGDPGAAYQYAALTVKATGIHRHLPAQDKESVALRVIADDTDVDDSNHRHIALWVTSRNAGYVSPTEGASYGPAIVVDEGSVEFDDGVAFGGRLTANGTLSTTNGQILTVVSGVPKWSAPATPNNVTSGDKGDITVASGVWSIDSGVVGATQLADDLNLSGNGKTTVGAFGGTVENYAGTGAINDYPLGATTTTLVITVSTTVPLQGIANGWDGRRLKVRFTGAGANTISVVNNSPGSLPANQIRTPGGTTWTNVANNYPDLDCEYDGGITKWDCAPVGWLRMPSLITSTGINVGGSTTTVGLTSNNGTIYAQMGSTTPANSAIEARSNGSTGGFIALTPLGVDDNHLTFDADRASSTWTAQDTSWASISKHGDKLKIFGATGATDGSSIATTFAAKEAAPDIELDLSNGVTYLHGGAVVETALVVYGDVTTNGGNLMVDGDSTFQGTIDVTSATGVTGGAIFMGRQIFNTTNCSAGCTYSPTAGTYKVRLREGGGGGGGGGCDSSFGTVSGGGASGAYVEKWIDPGAVITGGSVTIGSAGTAGNTAGTSGGNGGDTQVVIQGVTYTAKGGGGGAPYVVGGATISGSSAGDVVFQQPGESSGDSSNASYRHGGNGGSNPLGAGGRGGVVFSTASAAGETATGYGGGGGGCKGAGVTGGAGTAGVVIVEEYR